MVTNPWKNKNMILGFIENRTDNSTAFRATVYEGSQKVSTVLVVLSSLFESFYLNANNIFRYTYIHVECTIR